MADNIPSQMKPGESEDHNGDPPQGRILLVEDERKVAEFISQGLRETGYLISVAHDGLEGAQLAESDAFDLLILDWMLPSKSGVAICQELRAKAIHTPILMLTARDQLSDRIFGLDSGADDYLTKPFAFEELKARIRALLRRRQGTRPLHLSVDDLQLDLIERTVSRGGEPVHLSNKEFDLLLFFAQHRNQVFDRAAIGKYVWGIDFDTGTNYVDVYINYLRKKLDTGSRKPLIITVRGKGYMLKDSHDQEH